jgi:hypothetical protein
LAVLGSKIYSLTLGRSWVSSNQGHDPLDERRDSQGFSQGDRSAFRNARRVLGLADCRWLANRAPLTVHARAAHHTNIPSSPLRTKSMRPIARLEWTRPPFTSWSLMEAATVEERESRLARSQNPVAPFKEREMVPDDASPS